MDEWALHRLHIDRVSSIGRDVELINGTIKMIKNKGNAGRI